MLKTIPFMPMPYKAAKSFIRGFYPVSSRLMGFFPSLGKELESSDSRINAKDYISGALFTFCLYFLIIILVIGTAAHRADGEMLASAEKRMVILGISFLIAASIFLYIMVIPHWFATKRSREIEKDILFATRHLMIQTTAGVPLFDAIVSVSEEYGDEKIDYGLISKEFKKIVLEVKTGKDLTEALEESASRNTSSYYRKVVWQLANANRCGADIGDVLKNLVEYLSEEQRIMIQDYGSQLNPLALFYMIICIIAPTMGLIFLMILSTFISLHLTEFTFIIVLLLLVMVQIMFLGLIKSRRPRVAL